MSPMMANMMNLPTLLIVVLVILLLFGSHKIPQLMRGLGSGINEFKKGLADGEAEKKAEEQKAADAKAAEAKPADAKPADAKPAEKAPEGTPKA